MSGELHKMRLQYQIVEVKGTETWLNVRNVVALCPGESAELHSFIYFVSACVLCYTMNRTPARYLNSDLLLSSHNDDFTVCLHISMCRGR